MAASRMRLLGKLTVPPMLKLILLSLCSVATFIDVFLGGDSGATLFIP